MRSNYRPIGDYIALVDERNVDLKVKTLLGLSISKQFIPSVANIVGTNMRNYKIIRKNQFACSTMQVRRDKKMPVALLQDFEEAIISQAYPVFQIVDTNKLLPEYLMMWFSREEFDRHAEFLAVGGVRGTLEWEDFLSMELPVPSLEKQQEIVNEYNIIADRIQLNEHLNQKLEETTQALYKYWFVDFNFPISKESCPELVSRSPELEGKPYKSSGGSMVYNEESDKEIPEGWRIVEIEEFSFDISDGNYSSKYPKANEFLEEGIPFIRGTDFENKSISHNNLRYISIEKHQKLLKGHTKKGDILLTTRGASIGNFSYITKSFVGVNINSQLVRINGCVNYSQFYLGLLFSNNEFRNVLQGAITGSAQPQLSIKNLLEMRVVQPPINLCKHFTKNYKILLDYLLSNSEKIQKLNSLQTLLLSKMAKVEAEKEIELWN